MGSSATWESLYVPPKGHKLFRCRETGKLAIADESGKYPDDTDDGILYVSEDEPIELQMSRMSTTVVAWLPVWSLRQSQLYHIFATMQFLQELMAHKPQQEVRISDELAAIMKDVWPFLSIRLADAL